MNKIRRVSIFFKVVFMLLFIAVPVIQIIGWMNAPIPLAMSFWLFNVIPKSYQAAVAFPLGPDIKLGGFFISLIPTIIELFVLYCLIKLFGLYARGEIFSINIVRYFRNIGYGLLLEQLLHPIYQFLLGVVLTWQNPPGHRFAAITIDQTNFGILFVALFVILISWIMAEGCKLREEQQLTV